MTTAPLTCRVLDGVRDLEEVRPRWQALLAASASNEPTLSPAWLLTWWRVFGPRDGRRLCVAAFEDAGRLVGLAPLLRRRVWHRGCVPLRRLEFLATGERPCDSICSDYLNVIAERGAEDRVADAFADALSGRALGPWDDTVLTMMDGSGAMPALLESAFRRRGLPTERTIQTEAPYVPLPASWDAYLSALSKKHRAHIRYAQRDFDAWAGGDQSIEEVTSPAELERGKRVLTALHKLRWQDPAAGGVFRSPYFNAFHDAVMPQLLEAGALQLFWLRGQGRPVAAMYCIVWNNKIHFYQSGRDTTLPDKVRPGAVLVATAIRRAIEAGRREFDFLGGPAQYKSQFALAQRPIVTLRVARPGWRESSRRLVDTGMAHARALRKRFRRPAPVEPASDASPSRPATPA
jgi:CelD/BcsL family acetyltransferase involved in cellulose biosynthesis